MNKEIAQIINKHEAATFKASEKKQNKQRISNNDKTMASKIEMENVQYDSDKDEELYNYDSVEIHEKMMNSKQGECSVDDNDYNLEGVPQNADAIHRNVNVADNDTFDQNITQNKKIVTINDVTNTTTKCIDPGAV